jgi:outer membrane lipoprotein-sorting protein
MASQSGRRLLVTATLALLVTVVPGGTERPHAADLFDEIYRRGAPMEAKLQAISASFVETTSSTLLAKPLVLRGRVVAQRPSNVVLTYDAPDARVVRIIDGQLRVNWPARGLDETKDVRSTLRRAERTIIGKSPDELRKLFDITAIDAPDRAGTWKVTFVPRRRQMREGVELLHLWIGQQSLLLESLEMELPGGDTRRMDFSDVVVNPELDATVFEPVIRR